MLMIQEQMCLVFGSFLYFPGCLLKVSRWTSHRIWISVACFLLKEKWRSWSVIWCLRSWSQRLLWLAMTQLHGVWKKNIFEKRECFYSKGDDERRVNSKAEWQRSALHVLSNNNNPSDAYCLFPLCSECFPKHWLSPYCVPSTPSALPSWWPRGQACWPRMVGSSAVLEILEFVQGVFPGKALAPS